MTITERDVLNKLNLAVESIETAKAFINKCPLKYIYHYEDFLYAYNKLNEAAHIYQQNADQIKKVATVKGVVE